MAYIDDDVLKKYLDIDADNTDDDALMTTLISAAQRRIDTICRRTFEASEDTTRYFDPYRDVSFRTVYFDTDLITMTSLVIDGETIPATDYYMEPRNTKPSWGLTFRYTAPMPFFGQDENNIEVTGKWAYSESAPDDIKHATKRLAAFYYTQSSSHVFEYIGPADQGQVKIPLAEPKDVSMILKPYIRNPKRIRY